MAFYRQPRRADAEGVEPPQITTVDQHMEMRGKVMADIVIKKIHGIDSPRTVMLPTELVVRQSA